MPNHAFSMLTNFLKASRDRTQADIVKYFLWIVIKRAGISESGSVLVYTPDDGKLHLFNENGFLFQQGFLDETKPWKAEFSPDEGLAGLAFVTAEKQVSNDVQSDPRFAHDGGGGIGSMICMPISVSRQEQPFGVVSFHNTRTNSFDERLVELADMAAQCLGVTLDASAVPISPRQSVFIVHGRDNAALFWLKNFLIERKVMPIVLRDQPRTGAEILALLDQKIDKCAAGFVLLTPDDEGRLLASPGAAEDKPQFRARQNVIFEAGLLCARFRGKVCFLKKGQIEIPSDMQGLLFEDLDEENPNVPRLDGVLKAWGIECERLSS